MVVMPAREFPNRIRNNFYSITELQNMLLVFIVLTSYAAPLAIFCLVVHVGLGKLCAEGETVQHSLGPQLQADGLNLAEKITLCLQPF